MKKMLFLFTIAVSVILSVAKAYPSSKEGAKIGKEKKDSSVASNVKGFENMRFSATKSFEKTIYVSEKQTGFMMKAFTADGKTPAGNHFKSQFVGKTTAEEWQADIINTVKTGKSELFNDARVDNAQMIGLYGKHIATEFSDLYPTEVLGTDIIYVAEHAKFFGAPKNFYEDYEVSYVGEDGELKWYSRNAHPGEVFAYYGERNKIVCSVYCGNLVRRKSKNYLPPPVTLPDPDLKPALAPAAPAPTTTTVAAGQPTIIVNCSSCQPQPQTCSGQQQQQYQQYQTQFVAAPQPQFTYAAQQAPAPQQRRFIETFGGQVAANALGTAAGIGIYKIGEYLLRPKVTYVTGGTGYTTPWANTPRYTNDFQGPSNMAPAWNFGTSTGNGQYSNTW